MLVAFTMLCFALFCFAFFLFASQMLGLTFTYLFKVSEKGILNLLKVSEKVEYLIFLLFFILSLPFLKKENLLIHLDLNT